MIYFLKYNDLFYIRKAYVVGVGMTKFEKPGRRIDFCYPDMGREAGEAALKDAGVSYDQIEHACVGKG